MHRVIIVLLLTVCFWAEAALSAELEVITENHPPFSYVENRAVSGFATEIVLEMMELSGLPLHRNEIQLWPWLRGFNALKNRDNILLYTVARTLEREDQFQWVGPIYRVKQCILALADSELENFDPNDFTKLRIGTLRGGASEKILFSSGIPLGRIERVHDPELNIKKMLKGRLDAIAFDELAVRYMLLSLGHDPQEIKILRQYSSVDYYIALSNKVDSHVVERLQASLDYLKASGRVDKIIENYMN